MKLFSPSSSSHSAVTHFLSEVFDLHVLTRKQLITNPVTHKRLQEKSVPYPRSQSLQKADCNQVT